MAQMQGDHDIAHRQTKETIKGDLITRCEEEDQQESFSTIGKNSKCEHSGWKTA